MKQMLLASLVLLLCVFSITVRCDSPISKSQLIQFHWITTGASFAFIIIAGLLITTSGKYKSTSTIYYQLFKRQAFTSRYPLLNDLLRFTLGEIIVMFLYASCVITWFMFGFIFERKPHPLITKFAKGFGYVTLFNMAIVLLPVTRHSIWTWIFNISFERAVRFHRFLGVSSLLFMTIHFITYAVSFYKHKHIKALFEWNMGHGTNNLAGFITWCSVVALTIAALPVIRRWMWDVFQFCHVFFGVVSLVFTHFHLPYTMTVPFTALAMTLYAADLLIRYLSHIGNIHLTSNGFLSVKKCELRCHKDVGITTVNLYLDRLSLFKSSPESDSLLPKEKIEDVEWNMKRMCLGKYLYLWVWEISAWESHPFSISEVSMPDIYTVKVRLDVKETGKANGAWAGKLSWLADSDKPVSVLARFDGPFGRLTVPLDCPREIPKYDSVLLFGGGIGVTAVSPLLEYCSKYNNDVRLIWVARTAKHLEILPNLANNGQVTAYVTRETQREVNSSASYISGRPNFERIIENHLDKRLLYQSQNIAVVVCGPTPMVMDVLSACKTIESYGTVRFHIHTECFEL